MGTDHAQGVAHVANHVFDERDSVHLVDLLANQRRVAQLLARRGSRLGRFHSAFDILFRREVQVELEFLLLFGIGKIAPKEAFPVHLPFSGRGFMMRPMARTSWSQREDCSASCFLPTGVRR